MAQVDNLTQEEEAMYIEKAKSGEDVAFSWDAETHYFERKPYPVRVDLCGNSGSAGTVPWVGY